ncbi:MAG: hypothetical protein R8J94_11315 [Acidimicrobiia bacterium]|nr:hypothetical protein [Acidimicrobiia bacterium]
MFPAPAGFGGNVQFASFESDGSIGEWARLDGTLGSDYQLIVTDGDNGTEGRFYFAIPGVPNLADSIEVFRPDGTRSGTIAQPTAATGEINGAFALRPDFDGIVTLAITYTSGEIWMATTQAGAGFDGAVFDLVGVIDRPVRPVRVDYSYSGVWLYRLDGNHLEAFRIGLSPRGDDLVTADRRFRRLV